MYLAPSSGLSWYLKHVVHIHICRQTPIHIKENCLKIKQRSPEVQVCSLSALWMSWHRLLCLATHLPSNNELRTPKLRARRNRFFLHLHGEFCHQQCAHLRLLTIGYSYELDVVNTGRVCWQECALHRQLDLITVILGVSQHLIVVLMDLRVPSLWFPLR